MAIYRFCRCIATVIHFYGQRKDIDFWRNFQPLILSCIATLAHNNSCIICSYALVIYITLLSGDHLYMIRIMIMSLDVDAVMKYMDVTTDHMNGMAS